MWDTHGFSLSFLYQIKKHKLHKKLSADHLSQPQPVMNYHSCCSGCCCCCAPIILCLLNSFSFDRIGSDHGPRFGHKVGWCFIFQLTAPQRSGYLDTLCVIGASIYDLASVTWKKQCWRCRVFLWVAKVTLKHSHWKWLLLPNILYCFSLFFSGNVCINDLINKKNRLTNRVGWRNTMFL